MTDLELKLPPLGAIMAYRGVHALCAITFGNDGKQRLRVTHYATCLIYGREPVWGVWSVNGVFQRFFGAREEIARSRGYGKLAWRRKNATWNLIDIHDKDVAERRAELRKLYKRGQVTAPVHDPVAALFPDGVVLPWTGCPRSLETAQPLYAAPQPEPATVKRNGTSVH